MPDHRKHNLGKQIAVEIFITALIGLAMGFFGPFGTYAMPSGLRITYWISSSIIGYMMFRPLGYIAGLMRGFIVMPLWFAELLGCMVAAVPFALLVSYLMVGLQWDWAAISNGFALLYVQCTAVGFGIHLFIETMLFHSSTHKQSDQSQEKQSRERLAHDRHSQGKLPGPNQSESIGSMPKVSRSLLHERLPSGFPEQIDALRAEDHYVHVYAGAHKEMLLMRFSDAIRELGTIEGQRTHRSWWVARHAIKDYRREGRKHYFILKNDLEIPISQTKLLPLTHAEML